MYRYLCKDMKKTVLLSLRCPKDLLEELDKAAKETHMSRSALVSEAITLFAKDVRRRGGFVVPPYKSKKPL